MQRLHAAYLILRFLGSENIYRDLSSQWKGDRVNPLPNPTLPIMQQFSMYGSFPPQPVPGQPLQTPSSMQLQAVGQVVGSPSQQQQMYTQQPSSVMQGLSMQNSVAPGGSVLTSPAGANAVGMAAILNNYQTQQQQPSQQMFSQQQVLQMLQQQQQQPSKTTYR